MRTPPTILITGGAGFIGSHLVDAYRAAGWEVAVLDNLSTGRRENVPPDVRLYEADVRDADAVLAAFRDFRPDCVSHQAAQASVARSVREPAFDAEVNILGGLNVLAAARAADVGRVIFASSGGAIYGEVPEGQRAAEDWPARPVSPYAASKFAFEVYLDVYARQYGLRYTILRYANVYGPRQDPHGEAGVVAIFIDALRRGKPVRLYAMQEAGDDGCVRDYIDVGDVAAAHRLATERELDGCFNVGTGEGRRTVEVLEAVAKALGVEPTAERVGPRPGDLQRSVLDSSRLQAHGWRPSTPFPAGILRTARSFEANTPAGRPASFGLAAD